MNTRYLTKQEHMEFDRFLKKRKVTRSEVAKILDLKSSGSITTYFNKNTFKRTDFDKVFRVLENRANQDFVYFKNKILNK